MASRPASQRWSQETGERFGQSASVSQGSALCVMGMEGRLTSWNAGAERLFGYEAGEIVGRHFSGFFSREDLASGRPAIEIRTAHTNGYTAKDCWQIRKDGSRFWCRVTVTSLKDEKGRVQSFVRTMCELDSPQLAVAPDNMATGPAGDSPL